MQRRQALALRVARFAQEMDAMVFGSVPGLSSMARARPRQVS